MDKAAGDERSQASRLVGEMLLAYYLSSLSRRVRVLEMGASFSAPINVALRQLMVEHTAQLYWATNHIVILCILLHARPVIGIWADIYFLQNNCCY